MCCIKYVANFIYFHFLWTRCGYQMYLLPLPLSQVDHSNLLFSSAAPPLSSHQVREVSEGAAHMCMVRLAMSWRSPPPPFSQVFS